jgi:hypothetical protein
LIGTYTTTPTVRVGEDVELCVSTTARTFCVEFVLLNACGPHLIERSEALKGSYHPARGGDADWRWPSYRLRISPDWPSGIYLVAAIELETYLTVSAPDLVGLDGSCLVAVLGPRPTSRLLYKLPSQTYQAYNATGGTSLYVNHSWSSAGCSVSLRRPGCGTGGLSAEPVDVYCPASPRQTFWHWDEPFLRWLGRNDLAVDVVMDTFIDQHPGELGSYQAVVTAGHDEYWTPMQRQAIEDFVKAGGGYAVFGANTCWWRCLLSETTMTVRKDRDSPDRGEDLWWHTNPENSLLGLSYRNGGGWWGGVRPSSQYRVVDKNHPLLAGVDLDELSHLPSLAGYECDGYSYAEEPGCPDERDGCPPDFTVLAYAKLENHSPLGWHQEPREQDDTSPRLACIGYLQRGTSLVFNAGTIDWALHLDSQVVSTLTRNVLSTWAEPRRA